MTPSINAQLIHNIPVQNSLGEGIQWHADRGEIWWTDIKSNRLFSYHWESKQLREYPTPEAVCSFAFIENDPAYEDCLLVAFACGIAYYHPDTQELRWIKEKLCDNVSQRLNDGRVDRQGRFWVGSMSLISDEYASEDGRGQLYCLNEREELSVRENNIHISNGTCWSSDSNTMYFADSPRREIYRYAFDPATGENTQRELFHKTPQGAYPDGACVDARGYLWSAHWGAGKVVRYQPDGTLDTEINLPVSQPSCVAFGGENLNLLLVTSARTDLSEDARADEPQAGDVFIFETNITGLAENRYKKQIHISEKS